MDLRGSNVIVTGASTGIGRATALLLAQHGAAVLAVARDEARLKELAGEQSGINVFAADVTDEDQRAALVDAASPVDVLINNAGLGYEGLVEDTPMERVRQLFELNVFALIDLTQRVLPSMIERGAGYIVNVGSVSGYVAHPPSTVYSATKFAVQGFTDGLRREVKGRGVDVTLIAPGPIKTEFQARLKTGEPAPEPGALDRGLPPESVAKAILKAITRSKVPGYQTITVPRALGIGRLGSFPLLQRATDVATKGELKRAMEQRPQ